MGLFFHNLSDALWCIGTHDFLSWAFWGVLGCPVFRFSLMFPPLMGEAACFVRKMFVFWVEEFCKLLWGRGLGNFGFLYHSKIVPTHFMRTSAQRRSLCLFDMIRLRRGDVIAWRSSLPSANASAPGGFYGCVWVYGEVVFCY